MGITLIPFVLRLKKRKFCYNQIDEAALFSLSVPQNVEDEDCQKMAFFAIQQARMFAKQGITVDETVKGYNPEPEEKQALFFDPQPEII